jgi:integrase/recombinase XerC
MLMIAAFAGLRACEIARLDGEHVLRDLDVLLIAEDKGGGVSSVPIAPPLRSVFAGLPQSGPLLLRTDGQRFRPHNVSHWCNNYLHSIGISHTLHSLRHRFGTAVYRASGRDLRATQELLRHRTPVSTAMYTWVDPGDLATAVDRIPAVGAIRAAS